MLDFLPILKHFVWPTIYLFLVAEQMISCLFFGYYHEVKPKQSSIEFELRIQTS